jgi:hypothetical protein
MKESMHKLFCAAANAGGEPAFDAMKDSWNAFVGVMAALVDTVVTVIEPVLTIDTFVIENFVLPALDATVNILETSQKTLTSPFRLVASINPGPKCNKYHAGIKSGMDKCINFITLDYTKLLNKKESLEEWVTDRQEFIDSLHAMADSVNNLQVSASYQEFLDIICPSI